ncbi:hypothetical protein MTR67_028868 [Solanum verrucosum]|uniref:Uncharacterized protein n=1 Tax=Solanum verrucosum TaxID=315347 RepID=A0AAF0U0P8_SOLVR|nr:hypothetical protein MTR67_028868 [Solanum verrucosum]
MSPGERSTNRSEIGILVIGLRGRILLVKAPQDHGVLPQIILFNSILSSNANPLLSSSFRRVSLHLLPLLAGKSSSGS